MLTQCATCSSLMSSHAYESHRYVHDSTDRSFMCERGCMDMFFETVDELEMHDEFMHHSASSKTNHTIASQNDNAIESGRLNVGKKTQRSYTTSYAACAICHRTIDTRRLTKHMKCHLAAGKPFQCTYGCQNTYFANVATLANHRYNVHKKTAPSTCTVCNAVVAGSMEQHMRAHDSTGSVFECTDGCVQTFISSAKALRLHRQRTHNIAGGAPLMECLLCDRTFSNATFKRHMNTHKSDGRPFNCNDGCKETFFTSRHCWLEHRRSVHSLSTLTMADRMLAKSALFSPSAKRAKVEKSLATLD